MQVTFCSMSKLAGISLFDQGQSSTLQSSAKFDDKNHTYLISCNNLAVEELHGVGACTHVKWASN